MSCLSKKLVAEPKTIDSSLSYNKLQRFKSVDNGIAKFDTRFESYDFVSEDKTFDFRVYSISNLIAVGADGNLQQVKFTHSNIAQSDSNQMLVNRVMNDLMSSQNVVSEQK